MKCIEARRMVGAFVDKKLTDKETELFLKHIENCEDCMDELDIYYTMYKAIDTLDSGGHHEYDFKTMLDNEIRSAHLGILRRRAIRVIRSIIMVIAELLLLVSVYIGYQMKQGEIQENIFRNAIMRLRMRTERMEDIPIKTEDQLSQELTGRKPGRGNLRDAKTMEKINLEVEQMKEAESGSETEVQTEIAE